MNLKTLFARIVKRRPRLCKEIGEERAVALLRAVFDDLLRDMQRMDDGRIPVYRFGEFIIQIMPDGSKEVRFLPYQPEENPSTIPLSPT